MITLQKLQFTNFLSHSNSIIEFKDDQKILLDGKSGSGKSSIVEAILFTLYGVGRCDNNSSLIKRGKERAVVIIELIDKENNKEFRIERSITKKNKHELDVLENGKPIKVKGIKETQFYIEKNILNSSYLLFINSILYKQNNQETFVNQTASKRKDIILEIMNASKYDEYLQKTKEKIATIKTNKEVILAKIEGKQNEINNNKITAEKLEEYEKEETRLKTEIDTLKKQYTDLTEKEKVIAEKLITIKNQEEKIEDKLKEFDIKSARTTELNKKIIDLSSIDISIIKKELTELNEIKIKVKEYDDAKEKLMLWNNQRATILNEAPPQHDYQTDIDYTNRELIKKLGDNSGKCPKCGYIDPEREVLNKKDVDALEDRLKTLRSNFEAHTKSLVAYSIKLRDLGVQPELPLTPEQYFDFKLRLDGIDGLNRKLINAEGAERQRAESVAELQLIDAEQKDIKEEIKKIEEVIIHKGELYQEGRQLKDDIIKINGKIDELMISYTNNNQLLGIAKHAAKQIEQSKTELETLRKDLDKDGESLDSLELLKDAFGPNGLKAIVIDYIIPQLEDKVNNILGKLSDFRVKLETQKSGIGEDVTLEGLFITIINEVGEELDFDNFSGGEKVKISVAINEALAEVSKVGFRILDETIVALDSDSVQNFIVAMEEILLKVKQVICISHIQEIKNMFDEKITVTKVNGDSQIYE